MEAPGTTGSQFIFMLKTCILWFMDQAHELKWGNLGKCGSEGTKGVSSKVPSKGL